MKPENLFEIIGTANESFVTEAAEYPQRTSGTGVGWFVRFAAAACLVLVIGASVWFLHNMNNDDNGLVTGGDEIPTLHTDNRTIVSDFLMHFTSIFSLGISVNDGYITLTGNPIESPRVRWNGQDLVNAYGNVLVNDDNDDYVHGIGVLYPFLWNGRVATQFQLHDLGVGVPVITIIYGEFEPGSTMPIQPYFRMFQYVNGEFIIIRSDRENTSPPSFFRDENDNLVMAVLNNMGDDNWRRELFNITLENGVMTSTWYTPADPTGSVQFQPANLYALEAEIYQLMRRHFGHEYIPPQPNDDGQRLHMEHQKQIIAEVRELIPAFNRLMEIYRFGLSFDPDRIEREYNGRTYLAVGDPNFQTMQNLRNLHNQVFWFWDDTPDPGMPPTGTSPSGSLPGDYHHTTGPFFREFDGRLFQLLNDFAIFEYEGSLLFPQIMNDRNATVEYVRTTQDSVIVRVNVEVTYEFPGAVRTSVRHTMLLELSAAFTNGNPRRISNMQIEPVTRYTDAISELAEWHRGAVTGAIVIYDNGLYIDPVEVVWINDRAAMHAHGLTLHDFMHDFYIIHNDRPQTQRFEITPDTVFSFIDTVGIPDEENRGQMVETTDIDHFRQQVTWGFRDLPHEFNPALIGTYTQGRIIHFMHTDGQAVTRVIQEFIFTQ